MQKFFPWSLRKVIEKVGGESLNISDDLLAFRQRMSSSQRISPHFVLGENCSPVCICYKLLPQLNFLTFQFYSLGFFLRSFWATPQLHVHFTTCCYQLKIDPKSFLNALLCTLLQEKTQDALNSQGLKITKNDSLANYNVDFWRNWSCFNSHSLII